MTSSCSPCWQFHYFQSYKREHQLKVIPRTVKNKQIIINKTKFRRSWFVFRVIQWTKSIGSRTISIYRVQCLNRAVIQILYEANGVLDNEELWVLCAFGKIVLTLNFFKRKIIERSRDKRVCVCVIHVCLLSIIHSIHYGYTGIGGGNLDFLKLSFFFFGEEEYEGCEL